MHQDWNFDPAGAEAPEPAGPKPTPRRFRHLLRREQATLESLRPGAATCEAEAPPSASDRDTRGRFTKGNKGGTGNPFARQVAGFRKALVNALTDEDFAELARALRHKALEGDVAAMKLLFVYTLGKPTEAPDPDRLDLDDFQLLRERLAPLEEDWHLIRKMVPVEGITEAGHRVADLRAECWREEVLGPAAPQETRESAADAAMRAREEAEPEEESAAGPAASTQPARGNGQVAEASPAAFVKELLRTLDAETARSLAALGDGGAAPSANGVTAAGAPVAHGGAAVQAPSPGDPGGHPPSANGGHGRGAPSANGGHGPVPGNCRRRRGDD